MKNKRGIAFPILILAMIVIAGFVVSLSSLDTGLKNQVFRANNDRLSFLIAYSALSRVLAKVHSFSWVNRPFAAEPYIEKQVALRGGSYDLLVEDTYGKQLQADVYIRTHLGGKSRMYFWRTQFNDDLLEISNRVIIKAFKAGDAKDFPKKNGLRPFAKVIEDLLNKRANNQEKSDSLADVIARATDVDEIINIVDGRTRKKFDQSYPTTNSNDKKGSARREKNDPMAVKQPVELPIMSPPSTSDKPSAPGPKPDKATVGLQLAGAADSNRSQLMDLADKNNSSSSKPSGEGSTNTSMSGVNLNALAQRIISESAEMARIFDSARDVLEAQGGAQGAGSVDFKASQDLRDSVHSNMDTLISQSATGIANAPSAAARKAIEEMVSESVAIGVENIVKATSRAMAPFEGGGAKAELKTITTVSEAEQIAQQWAAGAANHEQEISKLKSLVGKISGLSKSSAIQSKINRAVSEAEEKLALIKDAVLQAEARVEELRTQEAAQASSDATEAVPPLQ